MTYLEANRSHWQRGYTAENVDHPVFRFYGRILVPDFGMDGSGGERVLDFGCGQGAAVNFFAGKGFDSYGVDIARPDLEAARERYPDLSDHFMEIDPKPSRDDVWFGGGFDVIYTIQTIYFLSDSDMEERMLSIESMLNPGGIFYTTMMTTESYFFEHSEPAEDGLRKVTFDNGRYSVSDYYINFTESEDEMIQRFERFEPLHVGFYAQKYHKDEGPQHHYTFVGRKRG